MLLKMKTRFKMKKIKAQYCNFRKIDTVLLKNNIFAKNSDRLHMNIISKITLVLFIFLVLGFCQKSSAQIFLDNPSFEGTPEDATMPTGWHACKQGTTPDILPGPWGVVKNAYDGDTYLGLISRDDGTWESIEQRLNQPLKAEECYQFNLQLSYSKKYAGYNLPLKLRIWGCTTKCSRDQLLAETKFVNHDEWRKYVLEFYPKKEINYLIFEAHFADGIYISYKGNILLDNMSEITKCNRASL